MIRGQYVVLAFSFRPDYNLVGTGWGGWVASCGNPGVISAVFQRNISRLNMQRIPCFCGVCRASGRNALEARSQRVRSTLATCSEHGRNTLQANALKVCCKPRTYTMLTLKCLPKLYNTFQTPSQGTERMNRRLHFSTTYRRGKDLLRKKRSFVSNY